jgi:hypothetical protein
VFDDVPGNLRAAADILDFRAKHVEVLAENLDKLRAKNITLTAKIVQQSDNMRSLAAENKSLREALNRSGVVDGVRERCREGRVAVGVSVPNIVIDLDGQPESATTALQAVKSPLTSQGRGVAQSPSRKRFRDISNTHQQQQQQQHGRRPQLRSQPSSAQIRGTEYAPPQSGSTHLQNAINNNSSQQYLNAKSQQQHRRSFPASVRNTVRIPELTTPRPRHGELSNYTMPTRHASVYDTRSLKGPKRPVNGGMLRPSTELDAGTDFRLSNAINYMRVTTDTGAQSVSAVIPIRCELKSRSTGIAAPNKARMTNSSAGGRAGLSAVPSVVPVAAASLARFAARSSAREPPVGRISDQKRLGYTVSAVPRPSATPDIFSRPTKRLRTLQLNPLG